MKMTPAQKARLAFLSTKAALALTSAELAELTQLKAMADADGIVVDQKFVDEHKAGDGHDTEAALTPEQLKSFVSDAVKSGFAGSTDDKFVDDLASRLSTATAANIKSAVSAALAAANSGAKSGASPEDVKAAIAEALKAFKPADGSVTLTEEMLSKAFASGMQAFADKFVSGKGAPLMQFHDETGGRAPADFTLRGKSNLTLSQAQLLNICTGREINADIPTKMLDAARKSADGLMTKSLNTIREFGTKALSTGSSGNGADLVDAELSTDLQVRLYLASNLASAMLGSEITMPSDPYKLPLVTTRTNFYVGSENPGSDPTESSPGTGTVTLTAAKLIGVADYSYEADEDALVPILGMLQTQLVEGAAASLEQGIINGDTTATHQDSDIHAVTNHAAKAFKGLRKLAIAGSLHRDLTATGITAAAINSMRKTMGKWGTEASRLLLVVGPKAYSDIIGLSETLTLEKMGAQARILTGAAASIYGIPIVVSEQVKENLNASGVYDGTTTTKGGIVLFNRDQFHVGTRRGIMVELDEDKKRQTRSVIASYRRAFQPKETPSASITTIAYGYNYTA